MIEYKYFGFDKNGSRWRISLVFIVFFIACSPRNSVPKRSSDSLPATVKTQTKSASVSSETDEQLPDTTAVSAGRALELGDLRAARELSEKLGNEAPSLLLKARLAVELKDYETAVRIYHRMTDTEPAFERMRIEALADALAAAGRPEEAATQLQTLIDDTTFNDTETYRYLKKQASWLLIPAPEKAIALYQKTLELAAKPSDADALALALCDAMMNAGKKKEARKRLEKLALDAASGKIMRKAEALLRNNGMKPKWSEKQRIERAEKLMKHRAFDAALKTLKPIKTPSNRIEAEWLEANILFKRRRHYREAAEAFNDIVTEGGIHADEARFLAARALSRQDRDIEAIKAYRAFAAKTKRKGRGNYARYLAARLEFYLGRHRQALNALEALVGSGKKPKTTKLSAAGDRRDAHFIAGVSAILLKRPHVATPHLDAASDGTRNEEVLKRNTYWKAVAHGMKGGKGAEKPFHDICSADPTDWYARMSAIRLSEMKSDPGPCRLEPKAFTISSIDEPDAGDTITDASPNFDALKEISPLVALFAQAGLFKDASRILRQIEKQRAVKRPPEEWIRHYVALEAPHHAIRRASREFSWPPNPENREMAEAAYPRPYASLVSEVEKKHALPEDLLFAIARKESLFDPHAVSWVGAMGMMQMMPKTYEVNRKRAGLPPLKDGELPGPVPSIKAAGEEFAHLFETFDDSLPLAIMAYNGGVAAVSRWVDRSGGLPLDVFVEKVGFTQTRNYVRRVTTNLVRYRLLAGKPIPVLSSTLKK